MSQLALLEQRKKSTISRLTRNSKLFKTIIHAIQEKKGEDIISLDLKKIPEAVADFFIICRVNNPIQLRTITNFVEEKVKKECGELPYKHEGKQGEQWVLIDYINVVVHIMTEEARNFYKLEDMWSDASIVEHATK